MSASSKVERLMCYFESKVEGKSAGDKEEKEKSLAQSQRFIHADLDCMDFLMPEGLDRLRQICAF
ncbi:MAG: hypothetical protein GX977_06655 [Firmicutes bacterium]|nr:hypothetical protein [Bacillota bacterium]